MICAIFMICILLISVTFMYFNGRNKDILVIYLLLRPWVGHFKNIIYNNREKLIRLM